MAVSSYLLTPLIYLFIHPEAFVRWFCFEKLQENSCGGLRLQTPAHVFSCEFCEINKMCFVEKLRTTASEHRIYILLIFVLILRQNRYLPLNSDHLLGKQRTMLRYRSQPSKISYLRFGDVFYFLPIFMAYIYRPIYSHQVRLIQKSAAKMLSRKWQNSQKSKNTQTSEVNSKFF